MFDYRLENRLGQFSFDGQDSPVKEWLPTI